MSTHKYIDRICLAAALLSLLLTLLFVNGEALGVRPVSGAQGYETRLFDAGSVHTIDIVMDGWDAFLETCENEEYTACAVVIDGEAYKNVGLRAKGNTSLSTVSALGSSRYSLKLEFDHYDAGRTYYGLDQLCLNNIIQDNTYMKDYLTYRMMGAFGVAAPLCSYAYITVNGEDWGLYLAVEGVQEGFLRRNYGGGYGNLYKPDSMDFGGGRGNGRDFDMGNFMGDREGADGPPVRAMTPPELPSQGAGPDFAPASAGGGGSGEEKTPPFGGFGGMAADVKLQYAGDDPDSYSNIFSSAKTDVTAADQARLIRALKAIGEGTDVESAVDVDQVLRYFVVHNFVVNGDSYTGSMVHNYYLYEEDGRLSMIPWDYNLAFGTFQAADASSAVNDPIDAPLSVTGDGDRPMADWIFSDEAYTALYHQYFQEFLETVDPAAMIEEACGLIAPYVERDPTKFCTYEEFEAGAAALKTFCALRAQSVSGQLAGTIPSTAEGQSAAVDALVDASGLALSDMGTMDAGRGAGFPGGDVPASGPRPDGGRRPERGSSGPPGPMGPGAPGEAGGSAAPGGQALLLLGISILVLAAGILAAWGCRRQRRRRRSGGRAAAAQEKSACCRR